MKITFDRFMEITEKEGVAPSDFYLDAGIAPRTVSEWKAAGAVPTCVVESFLHYLDKRSATPEEQHRLEDEKIGEAQGKGYEVRGGKITIPSPGVSGPIEIPDGLSHLVRFAIPPSGERRK